MRLFKFFFALFGITVILAMTSCSGEEDALSGPATCDLGGSAVKGIINAATVTVYSVGANGSDGELLAETTTDANGKWAATPPSCTSNGQYRVKVANGDYTNEANQNPINNTAVYTAIVDLNSVGVSASAESLAITPVTTLVDSRASSIMASKPSSSGASYATKTLSNAITEATTLVKVRYGLTKNPATIQINFDDPLAVATNPEGTKLGLILGAFTQQAVDLGLTDPGSLVTALADDLSDGIYDGKKSGTTVSIVENSTTSTLASNAGKAGFETALNDYVANPSGTFGRSDITASDVTAIVAEISIGVNSSDIVNVSTGTPAGMSLAGTCSITVNGYDAQYNYTSITECDEYYFTPDLLAEARSSLSSQCDYMGGVYSSSACSISAVGFCEISSTDYVIRAHVGGGVSNYLTTIETACSSIGSGSAWYYNP